MHRIFVYGTLKTNYPNHHVLKHEANGISQFHDEAHTCKPFPLVVASTFNIPFLLDAEGMGRSIKGEIYDVDSKMLEKLDELENNGVLYFRTPIDVLSGAAKTIAKCEAYVLKNYAKSLLDLPFMEEYTGKIKYVPHNDRGTAQLSVKDQNLTGKVLNVASCQSIKQSMELNKDTEDQILSAQLRGKFLSSLLFAADKQATFQLHENTTVKGVFSACDSEPVQILVKNLQTPSGSQKEAILRTSDIISFVVDTKEK